MHLNTHLDMSKGLFRVDSCMNFIFKQHLFHKLQEVKLENYGTK